MRIIRTKRSWGGWLALFALGLQLALSFGHIHPEDFAAAKASATQSLTAQQNAPGQHQDDDDGFCAICAVMHMAGASLVPGAPSVVSPVDAVAVAFVALARAELPPLAPLSFQARAPPQA